jgi:hypothetical protein
VLFLMQAYRSGDLSHVYPGPQGGVSGDRTAAAPPKCGATGVTSAAFYMPKLIEDAIGAKFNVVSGYVAGSDIDLAVERGEVQCRAFTISTYLPVSLFSLAQEKLCSRALSNRQQARCAPEGRPLVQ